MKNNRSFDIWYSQSPVNVYFVAIQMTIYEWDRVIINRDKTSFAYKESNPKGVTGTVTKVRSQIGLEIIVKWDNGTKNCYNNYDLTVVWYASPNTPTVPSEPLGKSVCQLIKEAESEKKVSTKDMPDWDIFATETSDITYL